MLRSLVHRFVVLPSLVVVAGAQDVAQPAGPGDQQPGAGQPQSPAIERTWGEPNILLITLDDLGIDRFPGYGVHSIEPRMPAMAKLIERGVRFERFWAMPVCSPTRASLLTGRFPSGHGVYGQIPAPKKYFPDLDPSEVTLPRVLPGYQSAVIGKWHLRAGSSPPTHPLLCGFQHHLGSMFNLLVKDGYFRWKRFVDGKFEIEERYATTVTTDDALAMAKGGLEEPWLLYVNYNAPHAPFHVPPADLHSYGEPEDDRTRYRAMCEAVDREIGRLLDGVDLERTLVLVLGDNGTPQPIVDEPWPNLRGKGTLYEGGVHVPLVVAGPGVKPGVCGALVSITDVHRTLVEYTGGDYTAPSSISFLPQLLDPGAAGRRRYLYAEKGPRGAATDDDTEHYEVLRDERWKLHRTPSRNHLYDLRADPTERVDLLTQPPLSDEVLAARDRLLARLEQGWE